MLKKKTRRLVFYLLLSLFVLTSPLLISHALGYTIDFSQGSVIKTGGIFVKSRTNEIYIYLDGEFQKKTSLLLSGVLLNGLQPGIHNLRLEKNGFKSWVKEVKVEPGVVDEIRDVLLIPDPINLASTAKEELAIINSADQKTKDYKLTRGGDLLDLRGLAVFSEDATKNQATSSPKIIATKIKFFEKTGDYVFLVNHQGFLAKFEPLDNSLETLGRLGFFIDERLFKFSGAGDYIFIIDSAGGGYLLQKNELKNTFHSEILGVHFDQEINKILLVRKDNLEVVWLEDNPRQPFQKRGTRKVVFESKDEILDAQWFFNTAGQHLIIQTNKNVLLMSIKKDEGGPVVLADKPAESISTSPELPNKIFIKKGRVTYKIEL